MHDDIDRLVNGLFLPRDDLTADAVDEKMVFVRGRREEPSRDREVPICWPALLGSLARLALWQRSELRMVPVVQQPVRGKHLKRVPHVGHREDSIVPRAAEPSELPSPAAVRQGVTCRRIVLMAIHSADDKRFPVDEQLSVPHFD